jgi:tetratricopeptide (TPR) repeat protein
MKQHVQKVQKQSILYWIIPSSVLSLITAMVYLPSLHYEFQFDDIANITKHFDIRHNSITNLFFSGTRWISYWLNSIYYSVGKFDPFAYRLGNVTLHTANGLLIFFILYTALSQLKKNSFFKTNAWLISCTAALLFLIHPVQTQTVSYVIQGELEGLAMLFILSMCLCLLKTSQVQTIGKKTALTVLLFVLALFSTGTKEIAFISPALLILFDWFLIAQGDWKSLKSRLAIHATLFAFVTGIYLWLLKPAFFTKLITLSQNAKNNIGNIITHDPASPITPWMFFISQFKVILHYLWIFIWPFSISVEYDWMLVRGLFAPDCIFPLIGLLSIAYGVYQLLRKDAAHPLAFGFLWFAVAMAPRSSLIPSSELIVDYKTYMASFGWLLVLAVGLVYVFIKISNALKTTSRFANPIHAQIAFVFLFALPLGLATASRNTIWRSGVEFWANIIQNAPGKARAYNNYGVELSQRLQQFAQAIPYFQKAASMDAKYNDPWNNLAVAYSHLGKIDEAIAALKQGLAINPYYPEGYNNLASFFLQKKQPDQAEKCLEIALKIRPYYGKAYFNMGRVYLDKGDQEKAWHYFKDACTKADMDNDIGFNTYGKVSLALQKYDDAIIGFTKTLEISPRYPEAKFNLANTLFLKQRYTESIALFEQVLVETPHENRAWYNKGEAHLKLNQPDKALQCFNKTDRANMHHLPIRIAACYEKLGHVNMAKQELVNLMQNTTAPENIKKIAQGLLNQINKATGKAA